MIEAFERVFNCQVAALRTDHGGEYRSKEFLQKLRTKGITAETSVPHHSETNPIAEITNRILMNIARTVILSSKLPRNI